MSNITISGASGRVNITSADQDPAVVVLFEQSADVSYYGAPGVGAVNGGNSAAWRITKPRHHRRRHRGGMVDLASCLAAGGSIANGSSVVTSALIEGYLRNLHHRWQCLHHQRRHYRAIFDAHQA